MSRIYYPFFVLNILPDCALKQNHGCKQICSCSNNSQCLRISSITRKYACTLTIKYFAISFLISKILFSKNITLYINFGMSEKLYIRSSICSEAPWNNLTTKQNKIGKEIQKMNSNNKYKIITNVSNTKYKCSRSPIQLLKPKQKEIDISDFLFKRRKKLFVKTDSGC